MGETTYASTSQALVARIKRSKTLQAFLGLFVLGFLGIIVVALITGATGLMGFLVVSSLPILVILGWSWYAAQRDFMKSFGDSHGLAYSPHASVEGLLAGLFDLGHSRHIMHELSGNYASIPTRLFCYTYKVGSGKNTTVKNYIVCEMSFAGPVPTITIEPRRTFFGDLAKSSDEIKLPLETEFEKTFSAWTIEDYQIEALQILSKEVLTFMATSGGDYSHQFVGNKLYVFKKSLLPPADELESLLIYGKALFQSILPRLDRLHDDVLAIHDRVAH